MKKLFTGVLFLTLLTGCKMKEQADLIVFNGKIYTVNQNFEKCSALAIKDGFIIATGSDAEILSGYSSKDKRDLGGAAVYPGFNDAHCHIFSLGRGLSRVDLRGAGSFEEILQRLKERYNKDKPEYLEGDGWDQNLWDIKEFPDNSALNKLFPDTPVLLWRIDFHAVIANDAAINTLNIKPTDRSVPKGEAIIKDGRFTGVFLENTADRFKSIIPEPKTGEIEEILMLAQQECVKYGLTSISHGGESLGVIEVMDSMSASGKLKLRTDVWLTPNSENLERFTSPYRNNNLRIGTIKLYIDGALGSRGALLLEPYSDMPSVKGIRVSPLEQLDELCKWAYDHKFQVATHCIGDAANRDALRMYSKYLPEGNDLRWRIEHAQIVNREDLDMFGKYAIVPSIQPTHATSDMLWADERLGERLANAYIFKELLDQLGWIPSGTDFPIEEVNPVYTFFAAVFRKNMEFIPERGFQTENALSRQEALRSMTIWAAKSTFEEDIKGSLEPGKYADFVVMDKDIMTIDEKDVLTAKVLMTFIGGEKVYSRD